MTGSSGTLRDLAAQATNHPESRGPEAQGAWAVVGEADDWLTDNRHEIALLLADTMDALAGLLDVAETAMPDSYFATDSRVRGAHEVGARFRELEERAQGHA